MHRVSVSVILAIFLSGCADSTNHSRFQAVSNTPIPLAKHIGANTTEPLRPIELPSIDQLSSPIVNLGRSLFHDTRLSGDGTISCASCHAIHQGGDDGLAVATGIRGLQGPINSPTVLNSGLNFRQFWNGRAQTLSDQAKGPVEADVEMGAKWENVISRLGEDNDLRSDFKTVFGSDEINQQRVVDAIASYEKTLLTPSPFDRYLQGDTLAISAEARMGYEKFKSYGCISCHQGK
ncbi:MAG: cytochrome-c peroxidase, partial [Granulosicoccus sp.]